MGADPLATNARPTPSTLAQSLVVSGVGFSQRGVVWQRSSQEHVGR